MLSQISRWTKGQQSFRQAQDERMRARRPRSKRVPTKLTQTRSFQSWLKSNSTCNTIRYTDAPAIWSLGGRGKELMALTRLLLGVGCVLLWTAVTACASADPASQTTPTLDAASLAAPSPAVPAVDAAVSTSVAKSDSVTVQAASGSGMSSDHSSATVEPVSLAAADDTSGAELDCTDEANRCDPACLTAVPSSRLLLPAVGDVAYRFDLPSTAGPTYSLESYRGKSNVVLVFYRAFW